MAKKGIYKKLSLVQSLKRRVLLPAKFDINGVLLKKKKVDRVRCALQMDPLVYCLSPSKGRITWEAKTFLSFFLLK